MPLLVGLREKITRDPRLQRMVHGSFSGVLGRGLGLLVGLVSLPLTKHYLGKLEYGIWVTISSTVVMLTVLDLGIANTLTNLISSAYAENDKQKAQAYFATAFWLTAAVAATLAVLSGVVWYQVNWGALLQLTDPAIAARARAAFGISIVFFLLTLPLTLANRVLSGYQQVHLANYFAMGNSVLGLLAILVTIALHGNLVLLMLAYCSAMLLGLLGLNVWLLVLHKPWIRPAPSAVSKLVARSLLGQGSLFFVIQLTTLVVFNADNLIIAHSLGAAEVTPYSIAWKLAAYASLLQSLLVPSLWPAFTEAYHKRELGWLRKAYRHLVRNSLLAVGAVAVSIGLLGRTIIRVWVGADAVPSHTLLWTMAFWAVLVSVTTNQALLLTATSRLQVAAAAAVIAASINLVLSLTLVHRMGSEGVILATVVSFGVCMAGPQAWEVRRVLSGRFLPEPAQASAALALLANDELAYSEIKAGP